MKKAFRIGYNRYFEEDKFREHIKFIKKYSDIIDEVALFVEYSHHGYWELEQQREISEILKLRMLEYKKNGIKSVGLNVLCTVGHLDEAWDILPKSPMQTMIGIDGKQSCSCLCPSGDEFKKYIEKRYQILASSNPDFIWLDDDVRIENHEVKSPCFCHNCITKFNMKFGFNYVYENLVFELVEKNNENLWKAWHQFQDETYLNLITLIKNAIYSVNEDIKIGYMSGPDNAKRHWIEASDAVKGRPGGGFYNDDTPIISLEKTIGCGVQISNYPEKVIDIQYEFENFPYQTLSKSMTMSNLECMASIMCGCNGIAFNSQFFYDYTKLMEMIQKNYLLWDVSSRESIEYENKGISCSDKNIQIKFAEIGLPIAFNQKNSSSLVLTGKECMTYNDAKIMEILSENVFIDGEVLKTLVDRGFGYLCGVKIDKFFNNGINERFTEDELNYPFFDYKRDCFVSFDKNVNVDTFTLSITNKNCRILANLETIQDKKLGPCMTAFENELGGRVVVSTYCMHYFIKTEEKRRQIQNIFDWLSDETTPIRINCCHKIVPFVRQSISTDEMLIMLVNASFDEVTDFTVDVRGKNHQDFYAIKQDGKKEKLDNNNFSGFKIDVIPPWNYAIISSVK